MNVNTNTKSSSSSNGFTIIEVALVLAIAGLIFLVVFLALPALQNSQKDTERKQVIGSLVSGLTNYESDNPAYGGALWSYESHLPNYAKLPTGYTITFGPAHFTLPPTLPTTTNIVAATYSTCGSNTTSSTTVSGLFVITRQQNEAAFAIRLSNGSYYCKDVQ